MTVYVQVACRTLDFTTGAQIVAGRRSPFPSPQSTPRFINSVQCNGTETSLADCDLDTGEARYDEANFYEDYSELQTGSVAAICFNPSGADSPCSLNAISPSKYKSHADCK